MRRATDGRPRIAVTLRSGMRAPSPGHALRAPVDPHEVVDDRDPHARRMPRTRRVLGCRARPVRILFANHTADWSGAEVALMRLLTRLSADHECAVACPGDGRLPEILDAEGFRRVDIPAGDV